MDPKTGNRSWQEVDAMKWIGREAPRYTSYPSAHHFESLAPDVYAAWLGRLPPEHSIGLYVHVPFCTQMCWFCGCNTQITQRYAPVEAYIGNLLQEIERVAGHLKFRPKVHSLHFGGGSPGVVRSQSLIVLLGALRERFDILADAEISIELDPRRLSRSQSEEYAAMGFNRISLGVQDTNPEVQQAINRIQPLAVIADAMEGARAAGLKAQGVDIVYGLPHQTRSSLSATIEDIAALRPDRISAFSYAHVPWHKKHQTLIDETALPAVEARALQYLEIAHRLQSHGYIPVGIDHFALPGDGLAAALRNGTLRRNFMGYTDMPNDRLIGLGASSISQLDEGMAQNITQATSYATRLHNAELPTARGWVFRTDDGIRSAVISQLMCYFRVDIADQLRRYQLPDDYFDAEISELDEFIDAGLVTVNRRTIEFVSPMKMLVRTVACVFDRYARNPDSQNRYSKVA